MGHQELFEVDGAHVSRLEDLRLITGAGTYAADWNLPGQLHAHFLRADRAHAKIVSLDTSAASKAPGVAGVYTGEDAVKAGYTKAVTFLNFKGIGGMDGRIPERPAMAHGRVRFVGEPVAIVVAESAGAAQDAAELIAIEYEDLPVVIDPEEAVKPGAAQLHESVPDNTPFEYEAGDKAATDAAFDKAVRITRLRMESTRVVPNPMEPRACLIAYEPADESYTVHVCIQGQNMMKRQLSGYTRVPEDKLRIVARDVGGGFGQRSTAYPEYCAVMIAAKATGRPVKWVSSRTEAFLSDTHGRGNIIDGELALDKNGKFLGMRLKVGSPGTELEFAL